MKALVFSIVSGFLLVGATLAAAADAPPKRLLLIGQGSDGHPPTTHEFMAGVQVLEKLLAPIPGLKTTVVQADEPWKEGPALLDQADGAVLFLTQGAQWMQTEPQRYDALKRLCRRQGGLVALHWAVGAKDAKYIDGQLALLGGTRGGPQRKYQILDADLKLAGQPHPILHGLADFSIRDEFYYRLDFVQPPARVHPLLTAKIDGHEETVGWAWERPDGGRSFGFVGFHFHSNWERPEYRRLAVQGVLWTLQRPIPKEGVNVGIDPELLKLKKPAP